MSRTAAPAYQRLASDLRTSLLQGKFNGGIKLPTEAELVEEYQVSRQTVRRAFHDVVAEGLVYRVPGRGTFAARRDGHYLRQFGSIEDLMNLSVDTELRVLAPLRRRVDIESAGRLQLRNDAVYSADFIRLHEEMPFSVTTVSLPPAVARRLDDVEFLKTAGATSNLTIISLIDNRLDKPIAEAGQSITAAPAPQGAAKALGCDAGDPVLRIDRLYFSTDGDPVELAVSFFLPEHYSYTSRLRRSVL